MGNCRGEALDLLSLLYLLLALHVQNFGFHLFCRVAQINSDRRLSKVVLLLDFDIYEAVFKFSLQQKRVVCP